MSPLVEGALKGNLLILIAAGVCLALRRRSAASRHLVWAVALVGSLLVSPASLILPAWPVALPQPLARLADAAFEGRQIPAAEAPDATGSGQSAASPKVGGHRPDEAASIWAAGRERTPSDGAAEAPEARPAATTLAARVWLVWLAGAAAFLMAFLVAALRLGAVLRAGVPIEDSPTLEIARKAADDLGLSPRRFRLRWTDRAMTPMTWGFVRPVVLLPRTAFAWTEERLRQVLLHELAHVARRDAWTQALSVLACVTYWFNPLVWWAGRQLVVERERASDDCVLRNGAKASAYAGELLEIARALGAGWTAARVSLAMARRSQVSGRLLAVLDPDLPRLGVGRRALATSVLCGVAVLLPLAALAPARAGSRAAVESVQTAEDAVPGDLGEAPAGLAAAQRALADALERRDPAAMAEIYARDAVSVVPGILPLRGRRAIQDAAEQLLEQGVVRIETRSTEQYVVGDKVCELGRATFWTASQRAAARVRFMTLWIREGGQWRIHRDYVTPDEIGR
jgi:uncharacterized protein (TIGR02246 family)